MSKEQNKMHPVIKWILFGLLVGGGIAILVLHNYIFAEDSFFAQFTHANGFITYLIHNAIPNLCQTILIIGIAVVLAFLISLLAKISFKSKKGQTLSKLFVSFLKWIIAICAVFFIVAAWGASTTITLASAGMLTLIIGLGSQSSLVYSSSLKETSKLAISSLSMVGEAKSKKLVLEPQS